MTFLPQPLQIPWDCRSVQQSLREMTGQSGCTSSLWKVSCGFSTTVHTEDGPHSPPEIILPFLVDSTQGTFISEVLLLGRERSCFFVFPSFTVGEIQLSSYRRPSPAPPQPQERGQGAQGRNASSCSVVFPHLLCWPWFNAESLMRIKIN